MPIDRKLVNLATQHAKTVLEDLALGQEDAKKDRVGFDAETQMRNELLLFLHSAMEHMAGRMEDENRTLILSAIKKRGLA